jgi:predicted  nucleic acid-binding Zn-ribbon protein
MLNSFFFL